MLSITIVLFRPKAADFTDTVSSLLRNAEDIHSIHILVSGNLSEFEAIRALTVQLTDKMQLFIHHRFDNLGFASGHNLLLEEAFQNGADAALILNPDVHIEEGSIAQLALEDIVESEQPLLLAPTLRRSTEDGALDETFDSAGIAWSPSGRHYDKLQGMPWRIASGQRDVVRGATGACLIVTAAAYRAICSGSGHFFDDLFLAYREDAELGVRAEMLGVTSQVLHIDGFSHVRTVRGYQRGNTLPDLLGVRNRFLLRWALGSQRPGNPLVSTARDVVVVLGTLLREKSSIPGLHGAFAIRRYSQNRGRRWRRASRV